MEHFGKNIFIMHFKLSVVCVFLVSINFCQTHAYNYCGEKEQKKLCDDKKHIVCDPEQVEARLNVTALFPNTELLIQAFIDEHNQRRQKIASGTETCGKLPEDEGCRFPKAARMRELIWDDELAFIAGVHVARCSMKHDQCRSTKRFPHAGQNLWSQGAMGAAPQKSLELIAGSVSGWYSEKQFCKDGSHVSSFNSMEYGTGHLTVVMNDRVSRVGCALAYCKDVVGETVWHNHHVTCNYDYTNMQGASVYTPDTESGSKCSDWGVGKSDKYEDLCANSGEIFDVL